MSRLDVDMVYCKGLNMISGRHQNGALKPIPEVNIQNCGMILCNQFLIMFISYLDMFRVSPSYYKKIYKFTLNENYMIRF